MRLGIRAPVADNSCMTAPGLVRDLQDLLLGACPDSRMVLAAAMGVRRHVKRDDDSVSLVQILSQIRDCAPQLTFEFYLTQFPRKSEDVFVWQKPTFKLISTDGAVASADTIGADIDKLKLLTVQVET